MVAAGLGALVLAARPAAAAPLDHRGDALVRIAATIAEVEALGLDVWTHGVAEPGVVVARVALLDRPRLDASGLDYVVLDPDLGPRVEAERARLVAAPPVHGGLDPAFYQDFRDLDAVQDRLAALVASDPARVSPVDVGLSLEGRSIQGVRIEAPGAADRPVVVVQGCQHAREWISVAATTFAAEQFATAPEGSELRALLDEVVLVVVPVANPDGYAYSWSADRYWRKNRRNGYGVDTNRNWAVGWGGDGASPDPGAENYRGAGPFSEPEPAAMRDLVDADPHVVALLDVHSYGQLVLFPWGNEPVDTVDHDAFTMLAGDVAEAMTAEHGQAYVPLQSADLYPASGNAGDWAYGTHGIYALGLELRPAQESDGGFVVPPSTIVPTGDEVVRAIVELAQGAVALGPGDPGDGGTGTTGDGTTTAAADDTTGSASSTGEPAGTGTGDGSSSSSTPPAEEVTSAGLGSESGEGPARDDAAQGCGCGPSRHPASGWWALGVAALGLRRRRRGA